MSIEARKRLDGTNRAIDEVLKERARQHIQWGEQNHPDGTDDGDWSDMSRAMAKQTCENAAANGTITWKHILCEEVMEAFGEVDEAKLREELIQVAAVAVAWVEAIDRRSS